MTRGRTALALAAAVLAVSAAPARAADVFVNSTADPGTGGCNATECTLREAIASTSRDIVHVPAGTFVMHNDLGANGDTIIGAGARLTTISGDSDSRIFTIQGPGNTIQDVTLSSGVGGPPSGNGGAILLQSGAAAAGLRLINSTVTGNQGIAGGAILSTGTLEVIGSTFSGNTARPIGSILAAGGAIFVDGGTTTLTNTTISGNQATDARGSAGGGIYIDNGALVLQNVTVAGNTATQGGGVYRVAPGTVSMTDTILGPNTPAACIGGPFTSVRNIYGDSCGFAVQNPLLGALAPNGGPTNTRALAANSPAINAGAGCPATDQRGFARVGACDIGAFEYRPPHLTVIKRVVNDTGGIASPDDFSVHVRAGGADVAGSPQPGTASGRTYTLVPGTYTVGEDADKLYAATFSGACSVTLAEGQNATCTITNNDRTPKKGSINAEPTGGTVRVKTGKRFRVLREGEQLKSGTIVDTTKGRITLIASSGKKAVFYDGIFKLTQPRKGGITTVTLVEKLTGCKTSKGKASAAAKKKKKRRLWGDGKGKFRTKGQFSSATVRGTKWLVEDRCTSTLTRVARGKVSVRDLVRHRTKLVKAGKRYIARAKP